MRLLCLHGYGTSARIFETQLSPIRAHLPPDWEFDFLDGEEVSPPDPGVKGVFPGPYLSYHRRPTYEEVQRAYEYIIEVVKEDGPFDGVLGFSSGAALAATVIATEAQKSPPEQIFKVAVFMNSVMPFDLSSGTLHLSYDGVTIKGEHNSPENKTFDWHADPRTSGIDKEHFTRGHFRGLTGDSWEVDIPLRYHSTTLRQVISIPTVHVIGLADENSEDGKALQGLFEPKFRRTIVHDGGHHIPRDTAVNIQIAKAMVSTVERIIFQH